MNQEEAARISLDVWEHNPGARRFYERYGFVVIGDRSFAVASGAETSLDLIMAQLSNELCVLDLRCTILKKWPDQSNLDLAALHGLLRRLYSLGLPLIAVNCVACGSQDLRRTKRTSHDVARNDHDFQ